MARKKKDWQGLEFEATIGKMVNGCVERQPMLRMVKIEDGCANYCKHCGCLPTLHVANFTSKADGNGPSIHPGMAYMACSHCGDCDGEWYEDRESALKAWNASNEGSPKKREGTEDDDDIFESIFGDCKLPASI